MKSTILSLLLLVSSANTEAPNCGLGEGRDTIPCGNRCFVTGSNFTDTVECVNGECVVNETSVLVSLIGEQAVLDTYCPDAFNACGETFCSIEEDCEEGVCLVPTPSPTLKVVTTCEDLGYCEDGSEACVPEVRFITDASCVSVEELCSGDKGVVCNDDATYIYKSEEWDTPMPTNRETVCWSTCGPNSGTGSATSILSAILALVGTILL